MDNLYYVNESDNGEIKISTIIFSSSGTALEWFIDILDQKTNKLEHEYNGKNYRVYNDVSNNLVLEEIRTGNFVNNFTISKDEISILSEKIKSLINL